MVRIKILPKAQTKLQTEIEFARNEYGIIASKRWEKELSDIYKRLITYPLSYAREPWLRPYIMPYRSIILRKNFKLIYRYDKILDIVIIVDLWNMQMNPRYILKQFNR